MNIDNVTIVVPGYNNKEHLKNCYTTFRKIYPTVNLLLMDDGSTDGTYKYLKSIKKKDEFLHIHREEERVGHTILYDKGISIADTQVVGILHADMIIGPDYLENMLKHLEPGKVVCSTRVEPPLHPQGKEKIIRNFGMDFDDLDVYSFFDFCRKEQIQTAGKTTKGMFAPWILYKRDFEYIGGHDPLFAPFPYEDSDIFQRWLLAGYELVQSRDSFVYHLTCRGHRWTKEVGQDDPFFTKLEPIHRRNYLRKWSSWIKNDEYQHPILTPKYDIELRLFNTTLETLRTLEPYFSKVVIDQPLIEEYLDLEQDVTPFDLEEKIFMANNYSQESDIVVRLDANNLSSESFNIIHNLTHIIFDNGQIGKFKIGPLEIVVNKLKDYSKDLVFV